jgi:hypothetical protein
MDGNFLKSGRFEVMLGKGQRRHFAEDVWAQLFQDAKHTADLLATVMDRRIQELKRGKQPLPDRGSTPKPPIFPPRGAFRFSMLGIAKSVPVLP